MGRVIKALREVDGCSDLCPKREAPVHTHMAVFHLHVVVVCAWKHGHNNMALHAQQQLWEWQDERTRHW